jgi:hypothetical protein
MSKKYSGFTLEEIRELLLNGELIHEEMEQEDYAVLMDNEFEKPEPNNDVIRLCAAAFGKYDETKAPPERLKIKRALFIAAAIAVTLLLTQLVAVALGFDLFGYIFNWEKERLVVSYTPEHDFKEEDDEYFEPVYESYENYVDIPNDIKILVPQYLIDKFEFAFASVYIESVDVFGHTFKFIGDNDAVLSLYIGKGTDIYIQRDDEYFEEYSVNGRDFTIYKNLERFKVIWIEDGLVFDMGVNLPLEEVKRIIDNI